MDKVTVANFINLANNMVGSGLIPTGEANYELAKEYATQQSRIDAIGFLKWFKDDSIIFFDDNGEMYNSLTDEFLSHEQVYELYDYQKPKQ